MFETFNTTVSGLVFAALLAPSFAANTSFASPGETKIIDGKLVLVDTFKLVADSGTSNRVVAAALMRTLSQEIPAAACHLHNSVDVEKAVDELSYSVAKFDAVVVALLNGNADMGIVGAETRRKTVLEIEDLIAQWRPIHDAVIAVLDNPTNREAVSVIYDSADVMMEKTSKLLSEIQSHYVNPAELLQSDLMLIEISARAAMMTQSMAFDACRVWSEGGNDEAVADLVQTKSTYSASMDALMNGLPALGILPPPTSEIAESLAAAHSDWSDIALLLDRVAAGDPLTDAERTELYDRLVEKVHKVEEIEMMYQDYSKRIL